MTNFVINDDGTMKSADQLGDASKFGDAANKAVFPNQRPTRRNLTTNSI